MFDDVLEVLIRSEEFDRLLTDASRPRVAQAEAGQDFVIAALARALDGPVMAVATGPHEAEALARGVAAYLGGDRVVLFPSWESLPYEGISPAPEIAARRAAAAAAMRTAATTEAAAGRSRAFVVVAPALAAIQGIPPDLGAHEPLEVAKGDSVAPDALAERLEQ